MRNSPEKTRCLRRRRIFVRRAFRVGAGFGYPGAPCGASSNSPTVASSS
ncbi:Hypothetical protein A7982_03750 [Minicystis rosea]|nr:Hypothetical protein A7982_03750 [Minicystis rosea]